MGLLSSESQFQQQNSLESLSQAIALWWYSRYSLGALELRESALTPESYGMLTNFILDIHNRERNFMSLNLWSEVWQTHLSYKSCCYVFMFCEGVAAEVLQIACYQLRCKGTLLPNHSNLSLDKDHKLVRRHLRDNWVESS